MRLNLSPKTERYVLIQGQDEEAGIAIMARPALSEVLEEAKADAAMLGFVDDLRAMEASDDQDITPALLKAKGKFGLLFTKAIARLVIEGWDGVEDPDGSVAPVTPDRVDAFLDIPVIYDAFTAQYLSRWLTVQTEKKGSAPSPNGTSAAARSTAVPAGKPARNARSGKTARKA